MLLAEQLVKKWGDVLQYEAPGLDPIKDSYKRNVVAQLLENTVSDVETQSQFQNTGLLNEAAPTNSTGGSIQNFDPVLIALVRRAMPNLIAYDICGVQPMTGPTGLIFAMRSRYTSQTGDEAFYNEANTGFSTVTAGNTTPGQAANNVGTDPSGNSSNYNYAGGMSTPQAEALGTSGNTAWPEMGFSIEKVTVTAESRALKAEYSIELAQDLKAIHGLDAESELASILSTEVLAEINREVVRTIYQSAVAIASLLITFLGESQRAAGIECDREVAVAVDLLDLADADDLRTGVAIAVVTDADFVSDSERLDVCLVHGISPWLMNLYRLLRLGCQRAAPNHLRC